MSKEKETKNEKLKKLQMIRDSINKKIGSEEAVTLMSDKPKKVPSIPSGSLMLDMALGIGGIPEGRIVEIYGPESSGKTTLTLHLAAEAQKQGKNVAFIDAEHALDLSYASAIGVNTQELLLNQPDYGEQGLEVAEMLVQTGEVGLIIIDSVAALTPKAEIEASMEDQQMGLHARMMSKGLRKITALAKKHNTTLVFINQLRMKIGVMFGNPETTTGGNALKFYASVRLDIRKIKSKIAQDEMDGIMKVKVVKNKVAPPLKIVEIPVRFGEGINLAAEAYELAKSESIGIFEVTGGTHRYVGDKKIKLSKSLSEYNPKLEDVTEVSKDEDGKLNKFAAKKDDAITLFKEDKKFADAIRKEVQERMEMLKEGKAPWREKKEA